MLKHRIFFLLLLINSFIFSQNRSGNLENYIDNFIENVPRGSGNEYKNPSITQSNIWESLLNHILGNDLTNARLQAGKIGYQITEFLDTTINQTFYVVEKKNDSSNHWGTYIFTKNPLIDKLIITAPHILNDTNTGQQAVYCLKNTLAKAVFLNGTERCNSGFFSDCSGTTTTCDNGSESFRISDVAHEDDSIFHQTTSILFNSISNSVFIQLHGFGKKTDDPYVIMSNGTRETPTTDYIEMLKNELFLEDNSLTFKIPHQDLTWNRLIAFTNTQGRLINESNAPCAVSSTKTTGRFISLEQELSKLRSNAVGWEKVSNAIKSVFYTSLGINNNNIEQKTLVYPNPTKSKINFIVDDLIALKVFNTIGKEIKFKDNLNDETPSILLDTQQNGIYFIQIITLKKTVFQKVIVTK
jgi:hypothetical protein